MVGSHPGGGLPEMFLEISSTRVWVQRVVQERARDRSGLESCRDQRLHVD